MNKVNLYDIILSVLMGKPKAMKKQKFPKNSPSYSHDK